MPKKKQVNVGVYTRGSTARTQRDEIWRKKYFEKKWDDEELKEKVTDKLGEGSHPLLEGERKNFPFWDVRRGVSLWEWINGLKESDYPEREDFLEEKKHADRILKK